MGVSAKPFTHAFATSSAATSFTALNATTTKPLTTTAGVFDLEDPIYGRGGCIPDWLNLVPWGTDADDETFDMRIFGIKPTLDATPVWVPQLLITVSCTLCSVTCTPFVANAFLVDTIVVNKGPADSSEFRSLINTADNTPGSIILNTRGCRFIKFEIDLTGAAGGNCLWSPVWHQ